MTETSLDRWTNKTAVLLLPLFFFASPINAACYIEGASVRLSNKCALEMLDGKTIDVNTAERIDRKLKEEGISAGLGFPSLGNANSVSKIIYPILSYSDNVNGGVPPEPLFGRWTPLEGTIRKDGVVAGFGLGVSGRYIYDEGRYLSYGVNASYAYSPQHRIGVAKTTANVCSVNHVKNWWYVDLCANSFRVRKDLTDSINSNLSIKSSKVFESNDGVYSEASFGINRYFAESYSQNQLMFGYDTIHSNGVFSALNITFGESVENELTTKFSVQGRVSAKLVNKPLTLTASYSKADGGVILGVDRSDNTYSVNVTYPIWRNFSATLGYRATDSTIGIYSVRTPTFGIQFVPIEF